MLVVLSGRVWTGGYVIDDPGHKAPAEAARSAMYRFAYVDQRARAG
jgi:hypothetical protein